MQTKSLKKMIFNSQMNFFMEAHDPISAMIVENNGFEAIWLSSLSLSTCQGLRDLNEICMSEVLNVANRIVEKVDIPILVDVDSGYGNFNNFRIAATRLEKLGIAGVCIEDKKYPKSNSFFNYGQELSSISEMCGKIKAARDKLSNNDFVIVARLESFIVGESKDQALERAEKYIDAGADAVLIHSKLNVPDEVFSFSKCWNNKSPIFAVPTTYYKTSALDFKTNNINNIIWANHNIRASIKAMNDICSEIRSKNSISTIENKITSINEIFQNLNYDELKVDENKYL